MPVRFEISHDQRLVFSHWEGVVTRGEVEHYHASVLAPAELAGYDELGDYTGMERFALEVDDLRDFAKLAGDHLRGRPPTHLALVLGTAVAYGMARMYETFAEFAGDNRDIRSFLEREEAEAWLAEQR